MRSAYEADADAKHATTETRERLNPKTLTPAERAYNVWMPIAMLVLVGGAIYGVVSFLIEQVAR